MSWMETYTGKHVDVLNMEPSDVRIEDIAHHLSLICRFGGACREFYSVAQHSVRVVTLVPEKLKLAALLHDAAEAYVGDIIRPGKTIGNELLEEIILEVIAEAFGLPEGFEANPLIKKADTRMLLMEARDLMHSKGADWEAPAVELYEDKLIPYSPQIAEQSFLLYYHAIMVERSKR